MTNSDIYLDNGAIREEYMMDKSFVWHVHDRPAILFWVALDRHERHLILICLGEKTMGNPKYVWLVKTLSEPYSFPSSEQFKHIQIWYYTTTSTNKDDQSNYIGWDTKLNFMWKVDSLNEPIWIYKYGNLAF